jgi:serine/threonine protein phosphatase 1
MAPGRRLYAVGDIHGRADLLDQILELIEDDLDRGERFQGLPILVFLGDYVDRGLESCACVERLCQLAAAGRYEARFLRGNHEAGMLTFMANPRARPSADWLTFGGMETLYSYGVAAPLAAADPEALATAAAALVEALPPHHAAFLNELELHVQYGDYLFVHAGLRPGRALDRQDEADLLGIRDQFLNARGKFPYVVVHGHTPVDAVFRDARRIAVDTGAYATGRLSAIRLMGEEMAVLSTKP